MSDDLAKAAEPPHPATAARKKPNPPSSAGQNHGPDAPGQVTSLNDPRAVQILYAEHSNLASTRSLVYTEAFTRGGMFLGFMSMSFVALALLAQVLPVEDGFMPVAIFVLAFDLMIGITTYGRIVGANYEDYLAVYGMNRIRRGFTEIAPVVRPFVTSSIHDDMAGVMAGYGNAPTTTGLSAIVYALTTSGGMIGLIVSVIGSVLAFLVATSLGAQVEIAVGIGAVAALAIFTGLAFMTVRFYAGVQARLPVLFPTPPNDTRQASDPPG